MQGWCADDARMMHGWCTDDARMMHGWCTDDAWMMHGWCMHVWCRYEWCIYIHDPWPWSMYLWCGIFSCRTNERTDKPILGVGCAAPGGPVSDKKVRILFHNILVLVLLYLWIFWQGNKKKSFTVAEVLSEKLQKSFREKLLGRKSRNRFDCSSWAEPPPVGVRWCSAAPKHCPALLQCVKYTDLSLHYSTALDTVVSTSRSHESSTLLFSFHIL